MKVLILLLSVVKILNAQDEGGVLCSARTCSDYITATPCTSVPDKCNIQNSTHNGLFLPSPDPCGCCSYCLENLNEGEYCARGEIGGLIPDSICGPGLTCFSQDDEDSRCVKMTEAASLVDDQAKLHPCSKAQADYDTRRQTGNLGSLEIRPECDDDGFYQPYKCVIGQTCFCLDKQGNRIFGEIPFTSTASLVLRCECSRKYHDILKFFDRDLHPNEHFRCASNGDYDTIQCIGDDCMCTDSQDGAPTFPTKASVNISLISSTTLPDCFDRSIHENNKYYHNCADKYVKLLEEVEGYKSDGYDTVFEIEYPKCDLEGNYEAVQKDETVDNLYYCADVDGTKIGNYNGTSDDTMNCNCARSMLLIPDALEKQQCCDNGNFKRIQCRREICYCVDSNGSQDVGTGDGSDIIETNKYGKDSLFCFKEPDCTT